MKKTTPVLAYMLLLSLSNKLILFGSHYWSPCNLIISFTVMGTTRSGIEQKQGVALFFLRDRTKNETEINKMTVVTGRYKIKIRMSCRGHFMNWWPFFYPVVTGGYESRKKARVNRCLVVKPDTQQDTTSSVNTWLAVPVKHSRRHFLRHVVFLFGLCIWYRNSG